MKFFKNFGKNKFKNLPNIDEINKPVEQQQTQAIQLTDKELFSFAKFDAQKSEVLTSEPYSYAKAVFKSFIKRPAAIIGIIFFVIFILCIIIIPFLLPNYNLVDALAVKDNATKNLAPSVKHLFGTDNYSRDLFFSVWIGARKSLWLAVVNSAIVLFLGIVFGLIWGFFRKIDWILIEVYNLITNIPSLLLFMLIATLFIQNAPTISAEVRLIFSLTVTGWLGIALFLRNQILIISDREYNIASKTLGTPSRRIMTKNLLPFLMAVIVTSSMNLVPSMVSGEVSLSYFGLGLKVQDLSLGALLKSGMDTFSFSAWNLLIPGFILAYMIITFYLIGIALADALDPRTHR